MLISVIIPTFNEEKFLPELIINLQEFKQKAEQIIGIKIEQILVDDGSTDKTKNVISKFEGRYIYQKNRGKGNAVRTGVSVAKGDYVVVLDADLEYSPLDILKFIDLVNSKNKNLVVYGSRYRTNSFPYVKLLPFMNQSIINLYFSHFLTILFFVRKRKLITDLLTGLKMYPTWVYNQISPTTDGFETDHEITLALQQLEIPIVEVPITYNARTKADGKKIGTRDAIKAIRILLQ
jgi:glycosyltransferase involved in cell wall biosynthesis